MFCTLQPLPIWGVGTPLANWVRIHGAVSNTGASARIRARRGGAMFSTEVSTSKRHRKHATGEGRKRLPVGGGASPIKPFLSIPGAPDPNDPPSRILSSLVTCLLLSTPPTSHSHPSIAFKNRSLMSLFCLQTSVDVHFPKAQMKICPVARGMLLPIVQVALAPARSLRSWPRRVSPCVPSRTRRFCASCSRLLPPAPGKLLLILEASHARCPR